MSTLQEINTIIPKLIDDVLVNPGIGFMTFQRFNGDTLNDGKEWTEGFPIEYQDFDGNLENKNYPMTSIAYFRIYWRFLEPKQGEYEWGMIEKALKTANERKQTLMLRIAPYGEGNERDVPDWYREMVGERKELPVEKWAVDPEDFLYAKHFGGFIRALGERYDGHPDLESVDTSIVGRWGEGSGSGILTQQTREVLMDAYIETFKETPLIMLLTDSKTNRYGLSRANMGYRADCLGDMGPWEHMMKFYPTNIVLGGLQDAWKKAPISFEVCWVIQHWLDMGWDIDYIIDQSLKWHISSFNAKSSAVPDVWWPNINRWLKKMGYRLALRRFEYPKVVRLGEKLSFYSWWENTGVAPCYKKFPLAFRLINEAHTQIFITDADIRDWLPGDSLYNKYIFIPWDMALGNYELQVSLIDPNTNLPKINLAIEGKQKDGWYTLGDIDIVQSDF